MKKPSQPTTCLGQMIFLLLGVYVLLPAASSLPSPTHNCSLLPNVTEQQPTKQQAFNLSCQRDPTAPADCNLLLYYNSTGMFQDGTTNMSGLIKPPFGIPAGQLPSPRAPWGTAEFNTTEVTLNRTEPVYNGTIWPMLFFFGGSTCHVVLTNPQIRGCQLDTTALNDAAVVLAFGGGLTATMVGGSIHHTAASMGVMALANTHLIVNYTYLADNMLDKGALYASWGSTMEVSGAILWNNTAKYQGPALYAVGAKVVITGSKFESNNATEAGGAMMVKFSNFTMSSTNITKNSAPTGGGLAVYDDTDLSIEGCKFEYNTAQARIMKPDGMKDYYKLGIAGAVYIEMSRAEIVTTFFIDNTAGMDGGAVRMQVAHVKITESYLLYNRAHRNGGAVFVGAKEDDKLVNSTLWLVNTTLDNNIADAIGGAVMLERRAHCVVIGCTIKDCKAEKPGGGISTVMAGDADDDESRVDDLATTIVINNVNFTGSNAWQRLLVGPYFNISLTNVFDFNLSSAGVIWRRRLCGKGEYLSTSNFCEQCPSYQYSTVETSPGHSERRCWPAPNTAYAPGGAVLVPLSGGWHGVKTLSFTTCIGCPELNATLGDIRRCPNPAACEHSVTLLASVHPNSKTAPPIPWSDYGAQLCNYQEGYQGILCGSSCIKGFGVTAPFKCNRCLGIMATPGLANGYTAGELPGPSRISAVYFVYWFVLTCWLLFTVRSFVLASNQQANQAGQAASHTTAAAAPAGPPEEHRSGLQGATVAGSNMGREEYGPDRQQAGASMAQKDSTKGGVAKELSRSIDITKVLIIYIQWVMLVINLPITWLPWSAHSSASAAGNDVWEQDTAGTSTATNGFTSFVDGALGVVFGRSASMDCFLQAWGILQDNTMEAVVKNIFVRAVGSAIVVPLVLFLSVLLIQLMLFGLRRPLLKLLNLLFHSALLRDKVAFIGKAVSGMSGVSQPSVASGTASAWTSALPDAGSQDSAGASRSPSFWRTLADNSIATVLAVSMFVYLPIARVAFGMLLCVKVFGSDRWVLDVCLQCPAMPPYTSWGAWALVLGVFLLVLCVTWPVGIAWVLIRKAHRGKLMQVAPHYTGAGKSVSAGGCTPVATMATWAVRYADYAVDYGAMQLFYSKAVGLSGWEWLRRLSKQSLVHNRVYLVLVWDSVLDLHRLTIALVSLCVMLHEAHQIALTIFVLGSYLLAVLLVQPWRARAVWQLQVAALAVLIASCLGIMASTVQNASAYYSTHAIKKYSAVIPWLVIAVNVVYLVTVLVMLARCVVREVPSFSVLKALWQQNKRQAARERAMQEFMDARRLDDQV